MKPTAIMRRRSTVLALLATGLVPTTEAADQWARAAEIAETTGHPGLDHLRAPPSAAPAAQVILQNVTVVDVVDGTLLHDQTVFIEGNRITAVQPSARGIDVDGARVFDGAGEYLIPGLWDMHVHVLQHDGLALDTDAHLPLLVANGVTGVRDMWGDLAEARQLREAIDSGERLGPRLLTPGTIIDGPDVTWRGADPAATPERGRFLVDSLASAGADFVKVYTGLPREVYFAVVERAREVGIPFAGHVPVTVRVAEASGAGQASMEHLSPFLLDCSSRGQDMRGPVRPTPELLRALLDTPDAEGCREMIERLAADGTWQVPTLVVERRWRSLEVPDSIDMEGRWHMPPVHQVAWTRELERQRSMPLEARAVMRDWFAWKVHMVGEMHRAGVPILAGTDVNSDGLPPFLASGFSLHEELELLVEAGLSPADALRTATLNPARFLGATDSLGTVESGKVADLVLLERNPLEDIGNTRRIRAVVLNGRLLTHDDLSTLRERVLLQNDRKGSRTPAQDAEVPRTRTFPGIPSPAFPYAQPEDVGLSSEKLDRLGDEITTWLRHGDFVGGEVLIVKDRKTVFHEAYGWSDREVGKPVERNSIWSVKSMSKPFTATAALMVAEEGRLSLDDPVSRYIPRFPDDRVTIRHLLTHTSGYGDDSAPGGPEFSFPSLRTWVEDWAEGGPTEPLGEYHYSDFNYAALGYIVEEVTGTPIDQFTEERIIRPLGLDDTSTAFSDEPAWRARLNGWYRREDDTGAYHLRWRANRPAWPYYPAAWGLFSTAMDYAGFMTAWLDKGGRGEARLLAEATVEEALRPHAVHSLGAYGYGWNVNERPKTNAMPSFFGHHGGDGTMAVAFPGVDAVVVFLTHSRGGAHLYALIEALSILEVFDHPGSSFVWADGREGTMAALTGDERARCAGSYRGTLHDYGSDWAARVWEEEGRLHLRAGFPGERAPFWWWHLVPLGDDDFMPGRYDGDRLEAIHPDMSVRFVVEGERATALYVMNGPDTLFSGRPADPERMVARVQAARNRPSLAGIVFLTLEAEGIGAARERFRALRGAVPDSIRLHEVELNALGYGLLSEGRVEEAIAVFEMNAEAFPEAPDTHDSLGEAYYAAGRLEDARRSHERAVQLAEAQEDENLPTYRANLERVMREVGGRGEPDQLLYVWMGDLDGEDPDFLAVFDVDSLSASYGDVVSTVPVDLHHSLPHHTEYEMPGEGEPLFANAHMAEKILLFEFSDPVRPRVTGTLDSVPPLRYPHDMMALPNGNVLVGYLRSEGPSPVPGDSLIPGGHGGLAEFTRAGELVRWASAADPEVQEPVRPYSFAVLSDVDRLVVTSAPMMEDHSADVVQVWRLSDLTLLETLSLPPALLSDGSLLMTRDPETGELFPTGHVLPFEPRVMPDGSVLLNTYGCGFYRVSGLDGAEADIENVHTIDRAGEPGLGSCGIPVHRGRFWVMTVGDANTLVTLDVSDPNAPREVARLETPGDFAPHWLAKDPRSNRLIVGAEGDGQDRMLMVRLDPETGELTWDERLRARNGLPGIDFRGTTWPHGETGAAFGHAALFQR